MPKSSKLGSAARSRSARLAVRKTYKLYIGGAVPAQRVRTDLSGGRRQRGPRLPQGRPGRGGRGPQGPAEMGRRHRVQPGPGPLPDRRDDRGPAGRVRRPRRAAPPRWTPPIDRWVWYAGWSDKIAQVAGGANPVAGPFFNISAPEPTGVVGVVAPAVAARPGQRDRPGDRHRQHRGGARRRPAGRGHPGRGAGHLRRARRSGEHPHRPTPPRPRRGSPRTTTSTRSTSPASTTRRSPPSWSGPPPAPSSGCSARRPGDRLHGRPGPAAR